MKISRIAIFTLVGLMSPWSLASTQATPELSAQQVVAVNRSHQQTQLQIQQQQLDNELMRLRLAYAGMGAELRQLTDEPAVVVADTAAEKAAPMISEVRFSHMRLQWLQGKQPRWRIHYVSEAQIND